MIYAFGSADAREIMESNLYPLLNPLAVDRLAELLAERIIEILGINTEIDFLVGSYYSNPLIMMTAVYLSKKIGKNVKILNQDIEIGTKNFCLSSLSKSFMGSKNPKIVIVDAMLNSFIKGIFREINSNGGDTKLIITVIQNSDITAKEINFEKIYSLITNS